MDFVERFLKKVAYRAGGFDTDNNINDREMLSDLILASYQDMIRSGVRAETLENPKYENLVSASLVIFVTDNLNASAGQFSTSQMYNINIDKLRSHEYAD